MLKGTGFPHLLLYTCMYTTFYKVYVLFEKAIYTHTCTLCMYMHVVHSRFSSSSVGDFINALVLQTFV